METSRSAPGAYPSQMMLFASPRAARETATAGGASLSSLAPAFSADGNQYTWGGLGSLLITSATAHEAIIEGLVPASEYRLWPNVHDGQQWQGWGGSLVVATLPECIGVSPSAAMRVGDMHQRRVAELASICLLLVGIAGLSRLLWVCMHMGLLPRISTRGYGAVRASDDNMDGHGEDQGEFRGELGDDQDIEEGDSEVLQGTTSLPSNASAFAKATVAADGPDEAARLPRQESIAAPVLSSDRFDDNSEDGANSWFSDGGDSLDDSLDEAGTEGRRSDEVSAAEAAAQARVAALEHAASEMSSRLSALQAEAAEQTRLLALQTEQQQTQQAEARGAQQVDEAHGGGTEDGPREDAVDQAVHTQNTPTSVAQRPLLPVVQAGPPQRMVALGPRPGRGGPGGGGTEIHHF